MKRFIMMMLLLAVFVLPLIALAEETEPLPEAAPVKKAKKAKKAKKKAVSELPRVNAEVRNLQVGQEGDKAVATYDLVSSDGVGVAEVTVAVIIGGKRRTSDQLSVTGDFGRDVRTGLGNRIVWNATADLPPGFEGDIDWDIRAGVSRGAAVKLPLQQRIEGPSYEDTVTFLKKYQHYQNEQWNVRIDDIDGCSVLVSETEGGKSVTKSVDITRVNSVYLRAPDAPDSLHTMNVVWESPQFPGGRDHLWTSDTEFAGRLAKALNHLRKLCGAKDDAF